MGVQHKNVGKIISNSFKDGNLQELTSEQAINIFYDERINYVNRLSNLDPSYKNSLMTRYAEERESALNMLKGK